MYIESLELKNYRNYKNLNISFEPATNILYGDNAQGKTNVLEAIYMAATSKSHRGNKDKETIMFEKDEAHIKIHVMKQGIPLRIDMHLKKSKPKGIAINGVPIRKTSELFGLIHVVFFSPEDLSLIKNGPAYRRKFIDMELCQLDKIYVHNLIQYNKILNQRNRLLKDISFAGKKDELLGSLDVWDMQMAEYAKRLIEQRENFVKKLNETVEPIHRHITSEKENLVVIYEPNVCGKAFYDELLKNRDRDLRMGSTSIGPHRDDIAFYNHDIDIRKFGSQGQQRTVALSLKMAEIQLVKEQINDVPILLLDDVLSELDSNRQKLLLDGIEDVQTIITCTGLDEFIENRFLVNSVYKVTDGTVERSSNE